MKLSPGETSAHGLDRVRLTEDIAERHAPVVDVSWRRGKRVLILCGVLAGCAGETPPPVTVAPPTPTAEPVTSSTGPTIVVKSPVDESRSVLASALATTDAHERCRLLLEATLLDPSSFEAQKARAESRCAPAAELLSNARAAFALKKDSTTAVLLATVAMRAGARTDAIGAADALAALETPDKLAAARLYARLGEHLRSAKVFAEVADARSSKGATTDALDARLDAVIETARGGKPAAAMLGDALGAASTASKGYGDAWVAPKVVEALAAVRNAGENTDALATKAQKSGLFSGPAEQDAFAIERAVAAARAGKPKEANALLAKMRSRVNNPAVRALQAVLARTTGSCADARAHARAHAWLSADGMRLDDDVAWARGCESSEPTRPSVIMPVPSDEVADMRAMAGADPLHARARIDAILEAHPDDVAAWLAAIDLAASYERPKLATRAAAALPNEPWIRLAEITSTTGAAQATIARAFATKVLPGTVESGMGRAIAPLAARALLAASSEDAAWDDVAESLVGSCAIGAASACLGGEHAPALGRATARLRKSRSKSLAARGIALSAADLAVPHVRLDVVLALVTSGDTTKASIFAGGLPSTEASLAKAAIAASTNKCPVAAEARKGASALATDYADAFATIDAKCK